MGRDYIRALGASCRAVVDGTTKAQLNDIGIRAGSLAMVEKNGGYNDGELLVLVVEFPNKRWENG